VHVIARGKEARAHKVDIVWIGFTSLR